MVFLKCKLNHLFNKAMEVYSFPSLKKKKKKKKKKKRKLMIVIILMKKKTKNWWGLFLKPQY
jgi:uncharacterized Rossmann fold enzyme